LDEEYADYDDFEEEEDFGWQQYRDLYDSIDALRDDAILGDAASAYLSEMDGVYEDLMRMDDIDGDDEVNRWNEYYHGLEDVDEMEDDEFEQQYNREMDEITGYLEDLRDDDFDYQDLYEDDEYQDLYDDGDYRDLYDDDAEADYGYDDLYDSEYDDYSDLYDDKEWAYGRGDEGYSYTADSEDNEWSNANDVLSEYYQYAQDQGEVDSAYSDLYGSGDYQFSDGQYAESEYGDLYAEQEGHGYGYGYGSAYGQESGYDDDAGYDEEAMYRADGDEEYDGYDSVESEWSDVRYPTDLQDNAWVWKLLILSFALGVCSCLCYYATKIRPRGGRYDFGHGRNGKYIQVGLDSAQSAYDHDDIIDQQSVIEQSD